MGGSAVHSTAFQRLCHHGQPSVVTVTMGVFSITRRCESQQLETYRQCDAYPWLLYNVCSAFKLWSWKMGLNPWNLCKNARPGWHVHVIPML